MSQGETSTENLMTVYRGRTDGQMKPNLIDDRVILPTWKKKKGTIEVSANHSVDFVSVCTHVWVFKLRQI